MARSMNKAIILGNLGKDPELKYLASGVAVCNFSVATSEEWKDGEGNKQERTDWHNVVAFRKLAEISGEYLKKGSKVLVEGKIQTRSYEKDGEKRYATEIVADSVIFLSPASGSSQGTDGGPRSSRPESSRSDVPKDDDLPF